MTLTFILDSYSDSTFAKCAINIHFRSRFNQSILINIESESKMKV